MQLRNEVAHPVEKTQYYFFQAKTEVEMFDTVIRSTNIVCYCRA